MTGYNSGKGTSEVEFEAIALFCKYTRRVAPRFARPLRDRYLHYDGENPGTVLQKLRKTINATLRAIEKLIVPCLNYY